MIINASTRCTRFSYIFLGVLDFFRKKVYCGVSRKKPENRVIVYPTICFKLFCIGFRPIIVNRFLFS